MCQQNTHLNVHARTSKPQEGFTCKDSHAKCFKTTNSSDVSRWSFESVFPSFSGLFLLLRKFRNFYTRIKRKFYWNIYIHTKWRSVKELRKNIHFCTFERRFSYAFDWKHDERHLPEQFAWRVEWREHGDTKIEVIECEFPICIYLICDTASSESGTRNLLGACRPLSSIISGESTPISVQSSSWSQKHGRFLTNHHAIWRHLTPFDAISMATAKGSDR